MERGRLKTGGDSEKALVAQDQFERSWGPERWMIHGGLQRSGTDMDGQEGRCPSLGGDVSRQAGAASRARASRRQSGSETIEPGAEGMEGDAAKLAELDVSQAGATKVGENGRPIDFAGRLRHGGASEDRVTGPILPPSRAVLKM
jgi:hypothetical protein